jgi:radical SAM protein with 4Fe4S-binding SPASM domain
MKPIRYVYAVWELTLQCNLGCVHCGSRAATARPEELSTAEALDLVRQMDECGVTEVTLIGGEAYLRSDWLVIAKAIRDRGMNCTITTGGYGISAATAASMAEAGIQQVSISIDGTRETHDYLRGKPGSWDACFRSLANLRQAGIPITCNSQINRLSAPDLPLIYADILEAGCRAWQLAITVPMGRAADRPEILLQPSELLALFPMLNELATWAHRDDLLFYPGNNIGYYGPYERHLRSMQGHNAIWEGCQAGMNTLGIEANGTIKGCPSLPTTAYTGGNIRETPLREILSAPELTFNAHQGTQAGAAHLWGFCRTCQYAELCRGGCSWTAHVTTVP